MVIFYHVLKNLVIPVPEYFKIFCSKIKLLVDVSRQIFSIKSHSTKTELRVDKFTETYLFASDARLHFVVAG
jgi:hypothetical protein